MSIFSFKPAWTAVVPPETQQCVNQAIGQIAFVAQAYALQVFASETDKENWKHDQGLELANGNLKSLQLELIDAAGCVLFKYQLGFDGTAGQLKLLDSALGVETPLINRSQVADYRLTYSYHKWAAGQVPFRHLFRLSWIPAKTLAKRTSDTVHTEHAAKISGGLVTGKIELDSALRREVVVTSVSNRGFAFAKELQGELEGIFIHQHFAQPELRLAVGQRLSAVVIQTPRGLQGREVRAA